MEMTFGYKLKKLRLERGMSQDELALLLKTSKQVISRYETNQRTPKITIAQDYANKLGVPLSYLIDDNISSLENDFSENEKEHGPNIQDKLAEIINELQSSSGKTLKNGEKTMTDSEKEFLRISLENVIRLAKQMEK